MTCFLLMYPIFTDIHGYLVYPRDYARPQALQSKCSDLYISDLYSVYCTCMCMGPLLWCPTQHTDLCMWAVPHKKKQVSTVVDNRVSIRASLHSPKGCGALSNVIVPMSKWHLLIVTCQGYAQNHICWHFAWFSMTLHFGPGVWHIPVHGYTAKWPWSFGLGDIKEDVIVELHRTCFIMAQLK